MSGRPAAGRAAAPGGRTITRGAGRGARAAAG
jgi:hypothetical protein